MSAGDKRNTVYSTPVKATYLVVMTLNMADSDSDAELLDLYLYLKRRKLRKNQFFELFVSLSSPHVVGLKIFRQMTEANDDQVS